MSYVIDNAYSTNIYPLVNEVQTQEEADELLEALFEIMKKQQSKFLSDEEILRAVKHNIGYVAGYRTFANRIRVELLFDCEHPVFGKVSIMGEPTAEEAITCGKQDITLKELRDGKHLPILREGE